jgi:purine-binding chemotaxis protein CheW
MSREQTHEGDDLAQYLTFQSAGEAYALPILRVKEIIPFVGATTVPLAPSVIRGLINLRGSAVAVIDLAVRFGAPATRDSKRTCVVIVDVCSADDETVMGILTDSVNEVIDLPSGDIDTTPDFGTGLAPSFIDGLAKVSDSFIPILNVDSVLASGEALAAVLPHLDAGSKVSVEVGVETASDSREHE